MAADKENIRSDRVWPGWRWTLTGLSALALALSAYLSWHYLAGGSVIGCGGGSPCDQVLSSRWSSIGGVLPVSGLATGAYLALLAATLYLGPATEAAERRMAWCAMLVLAGAVFGSAVWFTIVQKWIIGAFCPYCMATHLTGMLLACLIIRQAPRQCDVRSGDTAPGSRRLPVARLVVAGLILSGMLAGSQSVLKPPAAYLDGTSLDATEPMDPHAVPLIGSPDARHVVTLLFDYACPHCQQMHFMLDEVTRRYEGTLAFALCPTPLNTRCNPYIPRDVDAFRDSCDLAGISLAVWVADREAFPAFQRWMFTFESGDRWIPRSIEAARIRAAELVGREPFEAALDSPWIDEYLQACVEIYGSTGGQAVPKLVFGGHWIVPEPYDADDLVMMLREGLGVPGL